jgi:hypothetical protein
VRPHTEFSLIPSGRFRSAFSPPLLTVAAAEEVIQGVAQVAETRDIDIIEIGLSTSGRQNGDKDHKLETHGVTVRAEGPSSKILALTNGLGAGGRFEKGEREDSLSSLGPSIAKLGGPKFVN